MKWKYKAIMLFLTLLIFCVGSVCAVEPDNTTVNNQSVIINELNTTVNNQAVKINELNTTVNNQAVKINELNTTVNNQSVIINSLKSDNVALKDNNTQLDKRVKDLEYSKLTQSNRIKSLEIDIQNLEESNKVNTTNISNNYKKIVEHNKKLTSANVNLMLKNKELVATIKNLENKNKNISNKTITKVNKLNAENKKISKKDIYNSLKSLSSTKNFKNIKCGQYTFKLEDYLKLPLIKKGKSHVMKFKNKHKRLPNYVIIAGYKVPKNVYQKLYNI